MFSEAAIITSFIGFVIGLIDFLKDIFPSFEKRGEDSEAGRKDLPLYALTILPPTGVAVLSDPTIFVRALDVAGTYGISFLFGILPAILAFKSRYVL